MKMADVTPVYKKDSPSVKDNHCPVSILPNLSKIFERCFCKQVSPYFDNILSKNDCGLRKNYSAEHCWLVLLEKQKGNVDHGKGFGVLLIDLSKSFDCLPHGLFIAKMQPYGFATTTLTLIKDYLRIVSKKPKQSNGLTWCIISSSSFYEFRPQKKCS